MFRSLQRRLLWSTFGLGALALLPLTGVVKAQPTTARFRPAPSGFTYITPGSLRPNPVPINMQGNNNGNNIGNNNIGNNNNGNNNGNNQISFPGINGNFQQFGNFNGNVGNVGGNFNGNSIGTIGIGSLPPGVIQFPTIGSYLGTGASGTFQSFQGNFQSFQGNFQSFQGNFQSFQGNFQSFQGNFQSFQGNFQQIGNFNTSGNFNANGSFQSFQGNFQQIGNFNFNGNFQQFGNFGVGGKVGFGGLTAY